MEDRPAYVPLPESAFRAMKRMEDYEAVCLMDMLYHYALEGEEPNCDGAAMAVFEALRPLVDGLLEETGGGE